MARPLQDKGGAPLIVNGIRRWVDFEIAEVMDDDEFLTVGASATDAGFVTQAPLRGSRAVYAHERHRGPRREHVGLSDVKTDRSGLREAETTESRGVHRSRL